MQIDYLAEEAKRARRLAIALSDPDLVREFIKYADECEAESARLTARGPTADPASA